MSLFFILGFIYLVVALAANCDDKVVPLPHVTWIGELNCGEFTGRPCFSCTCSATYDYQCSPGYNKRNILTGVCSGTAACAPKKCWKKEFNWATTAACDACIAGRYNPITTVITTSCLSCSPGKFSSQPASTICTDCSPGSYNPLSEGTVCTKCLPGKYNPTPGSALPSSCVNCEPGTYGQTSGLSISICSGYCTIPGYFCPEGTTNPTEYPCPPGRYGNVTADISLSNSNCTDICSLGHYCPLASPFPYPCPPGRYGSTYGLSTSLCSGLCKPGFFCPSSSTSFSTNPCPPSMTSLPGATSSSDCYTVRLYDTRGIPLSTSSYSPAVFASVNEGGLPVLVWPNAGVDSVSLSLSGANVSIVSNCAPGDSLTFDTLTTSTCGATLTLFESHTASYWQTLFSTKVTLTTNASNNIPSNAPRLIRFSLNSPSTFVDIPVYITPRNDAPTLPPINSFTITEGDPAEILLVITDSCPLPSEFAGGENVVCITDPDPRLGRALTSSLDPHTDTYFGNHSASLSPSLAFKNGGSSQSILSTYVLTTTSSTCGALVPLGGVIWDCTTLAVGSSAWTMSQTTVPVAASYNGVTFPPPHSPFGWQQPSLLNFSLLNTPCLAQRYRLVFSPSPSSLPDDGCGSWNPKVSCSVDYEAAYCGTQSYGSARTINFNVSLRDTLRLASGSEQISFPLTLNIQNALEPPVITWADAFTLVSLSLCTSLSSCPAASPSSKYPNLAALDDATLSPPTPNLPVLLVCSQEPPPTTLGISINTFPLEGPSVFDPLQNANTLFKVSSISSLRLLNNTSSPACFRALAAATLATNTSTNSSVTIANPSSTGNGVPSIYVQAFSLVGLDSPLLMQTPSRAFNLFLQPSWDPTGTFYTFTLPTHLVRANRNVSWVLPAAAASFNLSLVEQSQSGTLTSSISVSDDDLEQDVSFSILNVTLDSCNGARPIIPYTPPTDLFVPFPIPNPIIVTDYATGQTSSVNATRNMRIGVGVDGLDLSTAGAACGLAATSLLNSCFFRVRVRASDSGNSTPSHSLLPPQPPTTADATLLITVDRPPFYSLPSILSIDGVPPAGLNTSGGNALIITGANLGLPMGQKITLQLSFPTTQSLPLSLSMNFTASSPCTVVTRLTTLSCITPPGWGVGLDLKLLFGSNTAAPFFILPYPASISYASATAVGMSPSPGLGFSTLGGDTVALSAHNLPPSNFTGTSLGWQGVLRRSTTVWGVPSEVPMNCSNIQSPSPFTSVPSTNTLNCTVPPGVGSAFTLDFQPPSLYSSGYSTLPTTSSSARVSYPPPLITSITQDCATGGAALCSQFIVRGQNLGAPDVLLPIDTDPAAYTRSSLVLQGFDMVQYAMQPSLPPSQCLSLLKSGAKLSSSCALHTAVNCSYSTPHTAIACSLDPTGWGTGFSVRVIVKGQASQWWGGLGPSSFFTAPTNSSATAVSNPPFLSYPTPTLKRLDIVWVAGASQAAVNSTSALANGGSLARLQGEGLSPLSQLVISVGGVAVAPFGEEGVGGYANTAPPSPFNTPSSTTTNTTTITALPPVYRLDGSLAQVGESLYAPQQSLLICIPPGFGVVDVVVWVGGRNASIPLTYTTPSVADFVDLDKSSVDTAGAILSLRATNIPSCAVCFSPLSNTSSVCTKTFDCSGFDSQNTVCKYPQPAPLLPSDITPYTCLAFTGANPGPLNLSSCALPSILWTWGGTNTSSSSTPTSPTSTIFPPCFSSAGHLTTSTGTLTRCVASNPSSLASFFTVSLNLQPYNLGQEDAPSKLDPSPITLYQSVFNPSGDLLRVKMSADLGFISFKIESKLPFYTLSTSSLNFNKFTLLGSNPSIASLNFSSPLDPPQLEPRGGEMVSLGVTKGGSYGVVLVYPDGMPLSVGQQRSDTTVPECSSQAFNPPWGPQSQYYNNSGWKPGPFICPITLQSNLTGDKCCDSNVLVENLVGCTAKDAVDPKPYQLCSLAIAHVRLLLSFNGVPRKFVDASSSARTNPSFLQYANFDLGTSLDVARKEIKNLAALDSTFLSRMVYEPCSLTGRHWIEMPTPLPCRVSSWNTNNISFFSPPWQGKTWVTFAVDGQYAANFFPADYAEPLVSNLTYTNSTLGGGTLTIAGSRFGKFPSLGSLWLGSGAQYLGYSQSPSPLLAANYVLFNYPGVSSQFPSRVCSPILLWTDTLIRCVIPEGVSGSPNQVVVYHNVSSAPSPLSTSPAEKVGWSIKSSLIKSLSSSDLAEKRGDTFVYAQGQVLNCTAPSFGTDGNYSVMLMGTELSRFLPSLGGADTDGGVVALFEPGPSGPPPLDCSLNKFWRAEVNFRLLSGIAGSSPDFSSRSLPTTFHSHTIVNFTMPVFEGDVGLSLMYTSLEPFRVMSTEYFISADPPVVTSVTAFSGIDASNENVDPCSDVAQFTPPSAALQLSSPASNLSQNFYVWDRVNLVWGPNSNSSLSYCLWDAWGTSQWASKDISASTLTSPCFRSNATSSGVSTLLRFTGRNFGVTGEGSFITILPPANSSTRFSPIPCKPTASNPTVLVNSTTLECSVDGSVPFGPVEVEISVAFKRVNLTRFGITLTSQCACGSFYDPRASPYCQPCPPGGTCRGGDDKARAIAGAWETIPEDWRDSRQVSVDIYGGGRAFPRFVPCPQEFRCLGDNKCKDPGTQDYWMCTKCESKWEEGNDLTCQFCTLREKADLYLSLIIVGGLVGGLLALLFFLKVYVYDRGCCGRWPVKNGEAEGGEEGKESEEGGGGQPSGGKDGVAAAVASDTEVGEVGSPTSPSVSHRPKFISAPLGSYIKVMLTYAQTLGALAAYTKALIPQSLKGKTNQLAISQLLPIYLSQLGNILDVGLTSHALRCVIQDYLPTYTMQMHAVMAVPAVVAATVLIVYLLYTIGGKLWAALRAWWLKGSTGGGSRNLLLAAAAARSQKARGCCARYVEWSDNERLTAGYLALLFTFLSIPMVILSLASLQDCAPETSGLYLRAEPSISCNNPVFSDGLQTYALGMGWLYLAFPAVIGLVLYGVFGKVNLSYFKFLVEGYKLEEPLARAWECLITVRKSLFVGLSASFVPRITDPRIQLVVTMFFITLFLGVQQHYRPLKFDRLNDLDGYALASQLAFCFSVMIRQQGSSGERVFSQGTKGSSYTYYFIDSGSTSSAVKGLGAVTLNEQAVFDLIAAYFAARFLFFWVFYLLDDKVAKGAWVWAVEGWVKRAGMALDAGFMRVWMAAASAIAKGRGSSSSTLPTDTTSAGSGKESEGGGSLASPALATPSTLANTNVLFIKRASHTTGWRHVKNPDGRSMFYPPEASMYEREAEVKAEYPEGDSRWSLPLTGMTLSGWHVHTDQLTGRRTARWECQQGGVVTEKTPPMDFPGPEDVTEGEWVLYWRLDDPVAPIWLNVRTGVGEVDLNAFPDRAVTKNGWTLTPDPDGRLFWLNLRTLEALWDLPQEEHTKAVWEVARPRSPPIPLPSTWVPIWDTATRRPLYWLHVELLVGAAPTAAAGGEDVYAIQNTPSGVLLGVALEPPIDDAFNTPPYFPTATSSVLNGGWRWKECPLSLRGFYSSPGWWPEDGAGPPPDTLSVLARSLPPLLQATPPQFNVWFQCNYWVGHPTFWVNLATGASLEGVLPLGATSLSGWRCESDHGGGGKEGKAADEEGEVVVGVKYVNESTGVVQRAVPALEGTEHFLWLIPPRDPWEWCNGGGVWRRRQKEGVGSFPSAPDFSPDQCMSSLDIPVGHTTVGGWRHVQNPLFPSLSLWIHPLLKVARPPPFSPSAYDEEAGAAAPTRNSSDVWRTYDAFTPPHPPTPSSLYRKPPLLPQYWRQDFTGALAFTLPLDAHLPGGWVHAEFHSVSSGGNNSLLSSSSSGSGVGQFFHTLTGASTHSIPPVCHSSYASAPCWRYSRAQGQWWEEGSGRVLAGPITQGCPLPGGWSLAPSLLGEGGGDTLCFVNVERREVRVWEDPPSEVLLEARAGEFGGATPLGALHKVWRKVARGGGLNVWVEDGTGAERPFEPPDNADLGGGWSFSSTHGAYKHRETGVVKYSWEVADSAVREEPRFIIDK